MMNSQTDRLVNNLVSYKEAASLLQICVRTLRRLVDAGVLIPVRIRRRVLFRLSDIIRIQEKGIL